MKTVLPMLAGLVLGAGFGAAFSVQRRGWAPLARSAGRPQVVAMSLPVGDKNEMDERRVEVPTSGNNQQEASALETRSIAEAMEDVAAEACALVIDEHGNFDEDQLKICEEMSEAIKLTEEHSY
uniref:Uncharacterized protein n=1 Tax=Rhizochromulina marina TaxID=1034831 RepID=A0A7S2W7S5_9STRA|mmetsp:Transcript_16618/g.48510  ORF Transcript_16618/g.48510 Transcript_16618/m.48510 type:complete len:124 (+) Transcript_16618:63-434(+)|eukprot:CAMPEP_0118962294 /NCGR_PEP_ID=MMETSP1173-20130426/686_1 /TAXON_ID=1034831 /ORGANISM="Rhizochromulina marina cf, Strain CCMP1243" /LENGTH=123 /DNA_ID=CAMNT_0006910543 /DNA_START=47 /DNA_END=418 /DNA_ORIENTATION=-